MCGIYSVDTLDKGMIHVPGRMKQKTGQDVIKLLRMVGNLELMKVFFWNFPLNISGLQGTMGN